MVFTREDAARAAQTIGIDFKKEAFQLEDLLNGMNTELARHGTKAGTVDVTHDDPTMTAKLAVANLRVSPSYYSQRVGKSAWERSLARGVKHKGAKTEYKTVEFELEGFDDGWTYRGHIGGLAYDYIAPRKYLEVQYVAGYILPKDATEDHPATLPADLEAIVWYMIAQQWAIIENDAAGLSAFSISDVSWTFDKNISETWQSVISKYQRW